MVIIRASLGRSLFKNCKSAVSSSVQFRQASQTAEQEDETEEFRVLQLIPKKNVQTNRRKQRQMPVPPPRSEKMPVDQHWPSVWPGPRTFHPASVPLPLHQGYPHKKNAPPGKVGNAELMKIPNFLHLTPPAIKQQCEALKIINGVRERLSNRTEFCTEWPKGLETPEQQEAHFPIEVITNTYCHSSPSIRDPLARIVTLKVGYLFDFITHLDIYMYKCCCCNTCFLLNLQKIEPWEKEKGLADMELFIWEGSASEENLGNFLQYREKSCGGDKAKEEDTIKFKDAVTSIFNDGLYPILDILPRNILIN
ncbi:hypothetical protein J437_LFUL007369 [Ladona fulva]|uniref:Mitochondrial ribosomal protein S35 n=1 Tax=Ladona fulva TaxID=123851 RepID=A0A8K0K1D2_LADFU|nr:hypothetical protein J437_LFUL007369 [Ladona fulva]